MIMKKIHKEICLLLTGLFTLTAIYSPSVTAYANSSVQQTKARLDRSIVMMLEDPYAYVDTIRKPIDTDAAGTKPMVVNDRVLVPVRFVSENFGAEIQWDEKNSTATLLYGSKTLQVTAGSSRMMVDQTPVTLDVPATLTGTRMYLPLRALSEALDREVFYDDRGLIIISEKGNVFDKTADQSLLDEACAWFGSSTDIALHRFGESIILRVGYPHAFVNNLSVPMDENNTETKPIEKNNRILVPIRFLSESLGKYVGWDDTTQTATITSPDRTLKLQTGNNIMKVNGTEVPLDVPAEIINDRVYLPLRAVSEAFDKKITYNGKDIIIISDEEDILSIDTESYLLSEVRSWFDKSFKYSYAGFASQGTPPSKNPNAPDIKSVVPYQSSIAALESYDENGNQSSLSTGFYVGKGLFLTSYHGLEGKDRFQIITSDKKRYEVEGIVKYDRKRDIALVKAKLPMDIKPVRLGSRDMLEQGNKVVIWGNQLDRQNIVSDGTVKGFEANGKVHTIELAAPLTYGSSGSPVFNEQGYVVGLITGGFENGNLSYAAAIDDTALWLQSLQYKTFDEIKVLKGKGPYTSEEESAAAAVSSWFQAIQDEDIESCAAAVHENNILSMDVRKYYPPLFEERDFINDIKKLEILELSSTEAKIKAYYDLIQYIDQTSSDSDEFYSIFDANIYTLRKSGEQWKIYAMESTQVPSRDEIVSQEEKSRTDTVDTLALDLAADDSIIHPTRPVIYTLDKQNKKLSAINYETRQTSFLSFELPPECLTYNNGEIYVGLLMGEHSDVWDEEDQKGALAIIDADTLTITKQYEVPIDPYDITADRDGHIYIPRLRAVGGYAQHIP